MQAIQAMRAGGPDVLEFSDVPDPEPAAGQLLVRTTAAGVNFIDTYKRSGVYPVDFPHIPGAEGTGTVVAVGSGVTDHKAGDRVAWHASPASYATLTTVDAE